MGMLFNFYQVVIDNCTCDEINIKVVAIEIMLIRSI